MRMTGGMIARFLGIGLVGIGLLASPILADPVDRNGKMTLTLPRQPNTNEMVTVRVSAGVLPRNARIVVRTGHGEIAGTIAPYGVHPGQKAGIHSIAIPPGAISKKQVTLRFEVLEKDAKQARVATRTEVEDAKLVLIPAVRRPEHGGKKKPPG